MDRKTFVFFSIFWTGFLLFFSNLLASSIYLPSLVGKPLGEKMASCIGEPLPPFRISESDLNPTMLSHTLLRLRLRSLDEGKSRASSIRCLRRIGLNSQEKQALEKALQDAFQIERELFLLFAKFLDNSIGLERHINAGYLKSRYDLLVILQTKTEDWILKNQDSMDDRLEAEFANLYLSILRVHYDFLIELDENLRRRYFDAKDRKQ